MGLVFQVSVACQPSGGQAIVSGNFDPSTTYRYELTQGSDTQPLETGSFAPGSEPVFAGLANGAYRLSIYDENDANQFGQRSFAVDCAGTNCDVALTQLVASPPTIAGGYGKLDYRISTSAGGRANLTVLVAGSNQNVYGEYLDANQSYTLGLRLSPGNYLAQATDARGCVVAQPFTVDAYQVPTRRGCTDPAADNYDPDATQDDGSCTYTPVARVPYFAVPHGQSLRFVVPGAQPFDNTLLADEAPLDFTVDGYCQLVEQADKLTIQILSNYQGAPLVQVRNPAGAVVLSALAQRVLQGAGQTAAFDCYLKPDVVPGRTRVYFNDDALPLPFQPGQRVAVGGTGTGLDGTYPVHDVLEDAAAAVPYLVITKLYPSGNIRLDGSLSTAYQVRQYDTYQAVLDFASVPRGCYQARVTAADTDFGPGLAVSEPLDVAAAHPGSLLLLWRNFDNAFGKNYSAGLLNRARVMGRFFHRTPAGEKQVLRNDDDTLVLLSASVYRKVQLETLLLPGYLHETLFEAFAHDFVKLQGVRVVLEGEYTYTPVERYTLGKGAALLELQDANAGNRDDLGDTDVDTGSPYLIAYDNLYLKPEFS